MADPSTSAGYTAKDQAQFAKLAASNGTWTCKDSPASKKPDVIVGKQAGNYYVWRESGDYPSTTYARWNHSLQAYTQVEIDDAGSSSMSQTKSLDPFNAVWTPVYPTGAGLYPFKGTLAGNVQTWTGHYADAKTKKVLPFKAVCTKT